MPDVIKALVQRYGFVTMPTSPREIIPPDGTPMLFSHGKFTHEGRTILIRHLRLFSRAVIVETASVTEDSELAMDDVLGCLATATDHPDQNVAEPGNRVYSSQLEIGLELPLERYFSMLQGVGTTIARSLEQYGVPVPPLQVYSMGMNIDPTKLALLSEFRIERRVGVPHEAGAYFSQAPLKTSDHIVVLEEFERTMLDIMERLEKSGLPTPPQILIASRVVP
jgi:hypothetical protein